MVNSEGMITSQEYTRDNKFRKKEPEVNHNVKSTGQHWLTYNRAGKNKWL